jgi:hypothetical protein
MVADLVALPEVEFALFHAIDLMVSPVFIPAEAISEEV